MIRVEHIEVLWALLALPAMILWFIANRRWRAKSISKIGNTQTINRLLRRHSTARVKAKFVFILLSFIFGIIALSNPQIGTKLEEVKQKGVDIIVALDVSNSMLAEDFYPSRIERSKLALSQLIDQLKSDRLGVVVFAGDAFMQLPITNDYAAAKLFVNSINTDLIQRQGTDIGNALNLAIEGFDKQSETQKVIIIITDGENHEEKVVEQARQAANQGITIHTIGMASIEGAPIPVYKNGKQVDYKKDNEGNTVVTQLNEETLKELADAGQGIYVRASKSNTGLRLILNEIAGMEKTEFDAKIVTDYEDRFQFFLIPAILCLILFELIGTQKKKRLSKVEWFKVKS